MTRADMNHVTSKAAAKHDLMFNKLACEQLDKWISENIKSYYLFEIVKYLVERNKFKTTFLKYLNFKLLATTLPKT